MQGPDIDPEPADLHDPIECLQVVHQIVCRVDEEASDEAVPLVALTAKDLHKFTCGHREIILIWVGHLERRAHIRHLNLEKGVLVSLQVVEIVDIGVQCELVDLL